MEQILLNGEWILKESGTEDSYSVKVPGTVLSCLVDHKVIEDPFYRENEYKTRELFWKDYEFLREFEVPEEMLKEEWVNLVCEGLDTLADIYVNGRLIASANNMHRTWRIPVKDALQIGTNQIRIVFRSVLKYIENYEYRKNREIKYVPCGAMKGNQLLRKAHSMFGWDWGPQLIDAGIFRDIYIESYTKAVLDEVKIHSEILEEKGNETADITVSVKTKGKIGKGQKISVSIKEKASGMQVMQTEKTIASEETKVQLVVKNPKKWWPNGYGAQNLYVICVEVLEESGEITDKQEKNIGIRTLTISQEKDEWGQEFAFMVNGIKIFTRGGNYIPEDCLYTKITKERQEYLLKSCLEANFNCIRIWGGGYYPTDTFYDLCDEYGLIVWQDLMYACNVYDVTDEFAENIRQETLDNVKRLRHHACLGLWCGNNEIESAWDHWGDFQVESQYLRADYVKQFEDILPKAVKEADADTFYWPSSPSSGGCFDAPDAENRGDNHYWDVWHGQKPFSDYQKYFFRFCSEFGFQSFPCMKTVETFTREEDRNIFSEVMESHQKNDAANGKMLYYLSENFRYPKDFKSLLYTTQILQAMAIKSGVEHWRRNRGRCMGTLYWQVNDNWPVASWSSIDYFGRWKALHYAAVHFYAPFAVSIKREGTKIAVYLENEQFVSQDYQMTLNLKTLDFKVLDSINAKGAIRAFSAEKVLEKEYETIFSEEVKKQQVFVEVIVTLPDGTVCKEVEIFVPYKYLDLNETIVETAVAEEEEAYRITLKANTFTPFLEMDFADADAVFSDNYIMLTGEEPTEIILKKSKIFSGSFKDASDVKKRLILQSVRDTY